MRSCGGRQMGKTSRRPAVTSEHQLRMKVAQEVFRLTDSTYRRNAVRLACLLLAGSPILAGCLAQSNSLPIPSTRGDAARVVVEVAESSRQTTVTNREQIRKITGYVDAMPTLRSATTTCLPGRLWSGFSIYFYDVRSTRPYEAAYLEGTGCNIGTVDHYGLSGLSRKGSDFASGGAVNGIAHLLGIRLGHP
jgi:hypothetical protein